MEGNGDFAVESGAMTNNYTIRHLMPFILLSLLVHCILLFGVRVTKSNFVSPVPHALRVELQDLQNNTWVHQEIVSEEGSSGADAEKAVSKPSPREIALPSKEDASHDLAQDAIALAGRIAYEDAKFSDREMSQVPSEWVGAYTGSYSGRNPKLHGDSGELRLNITKAGMITNCVILSSHLGTIACFGEVDHAGNLSFLAMDSEAVDVDFNGAISSTPSPHFSGTWTALHYQSGSRFSGTFNSSKVTIQALVGM